MNVAAVFQEAIAALNTRDMPRAEQKFKQVLNSDPSHVPALNLLTVALMSMERFADAEPFIARAVALNANSDVSFYNYGLIAKRMNKLALAAEQFGKALKLNPNVPETWNNRGTVWSDLKEYERAVSDFDRATNLNPNYADAYANKGKSLLQLKRYDEASIAFDKALRLDPSHVFALNLFAVVLINMRRYADAEAIVARAIALNNNSGIPFCNSGLIAKAQNRPHLAIEQFNKALSLDPNAFETWNNRGIVWNDLKQYELAISDFDRAIDLNPDCADAYANKGKSLLQLERHSDAFSAFDKALSLNPDLGGAEGQRLDAKMLVCNWVNATEDIAHLSDSVRSEKPVCPPFTLLYLSESAQDQLACARAWIAAEHPPSKDPVWQGQVYRHDKIRIGYVSADYHKHATAYLMAELFELHDRSRFHITALSLGPDDKSDIRQRLIESFDEFVECKDLSDLEIAKRVFDSEIDILVDLKGFTGDSCTNVFARRPAPVQVNYLGYPGTMGAPYTDYIIGDTTLFDRSDEGSYSEKLVRLPHTYQPNDRKRRIADKTPTRNECGLPEAGFVFCCFNNNYKILPATFDSWMRILGRCDGSVLWLLESSAAVSENLRKEAAARGIDPDRLVFAKRTELPEHLARHRLADLFLDTLPYNAHTTTSDALWAGLPVLTQIGKTFAGRVAASLLNAIGLPELITHSREDYEALAIELAGNREKLLNLKTRLDQNRLTTPLFDTALFTRHLEAAYEAMYRRYQDGLPPDHIDVQPIAPG